MSNPPRQFTVEEANQRLPLVRVIAADIKETYERIRERETRLSRVSRNPRSHKSDQPDSLHSEEIEFERDQLGSDLELLTQFTEELESLGIELQDAAEGYVDFPARIDGREVALCWKVGEREVEHWHELGADPAERISLYQGSLTFDPSADDQSGQGDGPA